MPLDLLRGRMRVIAIKEAAVDLAPWADVAYGCDAAWWKYRRGLPGFRGLKVAWAPAVGAEFPDVHLIKIREARRSKPNDRKYVDEILTDTPGMVGSGCNSGFQAINLAIQFGVRRVVLVGFSLAGKHYYGRNEWPKAGNPTEAHFDDCRRAYEANVPVLRSLGVDVVNATPASTLTCFRHAALDRVISDWC